MFSVRSVVTRENRDQVVQTMQDWKRMALDELEKIPDSQEKHSKYMKLFWGSFSEEASSISRFLGRPIGKEGANAIVAYKEHNADKIEAIAIYQNETDCLKWQFVLQNPEDFKSGASTSLAQRLFREVHSSGKTKIEAEASWSSFRFYDKLGFQFLSKPISERRKRELMQITAEKIQEKLPK